MHEIERHNILKAFLICLLNGEEFEPTSFAFAAEITAAADNPYLSSRSVMEANMRESLTKVFATAYQ